MADRTVDARGLSCPEPVWLSKQALDGVGAGTIEVVVDTAASRENVTRMARSLGCSVESERAGDGRFVLQIKKG
jgi:TusA-related sulfurtransferase